MSGDIDTRFEKAGKEVQQLSKAPDNDTMLKLYALFKQATKGDVQGDRPGMMDFVGRAKYDAWQTLSGTPQEKAKEDYIALVESLKAADRKA